jgi:hypothetical protein
MASLAAAAIPGACVWTAIVFFAGIAGAPAALALAPQRHVAFIVISCGAWSAGLALPRLAAGALWAGAIVALAVSRTAFGDHIMAVQGSPDGIGQVISTAAVFMLCPFLLLGSFAAATDTRVLATITLGAAAIAWAGVSFLARRDYTLAESA